MNDATLIEARGVNFAFPRERPVLQNVNFTVGHEVIAVTGASGSGKSTLLMCLAGLHVPDSGSISVAGHRIDGADIAERCRVRRELLGLVFQFSELVAELTLAENVALPLELLGPRHRPALARAKDLLTELGMAELADRHPAQVSGGQAQRVAVARALIHNPRVILADEPTGSLDGDSAAHVLETLTGPARQRGAAVVVVTHDQAVAAWADRIVDIASISSRETVAVA